uniref:FAM69 N-terminal domain-containing protein n=1 Tax=Scylla olivacea TaxID=85551 RepID=A0A0P4W969_SCYOL
MKITFLLPCCIAKFIEDMIMNRRKRKRVLLWSSVIAMVVVVLAVMTVREVLLVSSFLCTTSDVINNHITALCADVGQDADQKLCQELCVKDVASQVTCHTLHLNKAAVFTLTSQDSSKKVVKSVIDAAEREVAVDGIQDELDDLYWNQKFEQQHIPSKEDFFTLVTTYVNNFVGSEVSWEVISKLVNYSHLYSTATESPANHQSFGKLIQDHEFLTSVVFEELHLFPKITGICGSYYAVEYFEPLTRNPMQPFTMTWRNRLWKALDILKYIGQLETVGREPIHLCDVKHDHFGWDKGDRLAFLDLDSVLYESSLLKMMENTPYCSNHEDCSYFDCKSRCHHRTNRCEMERSNTNLQVICDKIFLGNTDSLLSLYGLLVSSERTEDLEEALELCRTNRGMTVDNMVDILSRASNALLF